MTLNISYGYTKYIDFIALVAKDEERIIQYYEMIRFSGDFSPITFPLYKNYEPDFHQFGNRLIAAVHYITHSEMARIRSNL
ncbi:MAG: hypothetical protein ACLFT3_01885 [Cyclobacteriaceae bacterium]